MARSTEIAGVVPGALLDAAIPVATAVLAAERTLPVAGPLAPLLPEGALVRGRTMATQGVAATSLALALGVEAVTAGAWLAVVDLPWVGIEAAAELGITLERLVRVDGRPGPDAAGVVGERTVRVDGRRGPDAACVTGERNSGESWAELVAALTDGFEIIVTRLPARISPSLVRKVHTRVQAREAVLILVDDTAGDTASDTTRAGVDVTLRTSDPVWEGVADGHGHLAIRRIEVAATGRRIVRPRRVELLLPGPAGTVAATSRRHLGEPEPALLDDFDDGMVGGRQDGMTDGMTDGAA